MRQSKNSINETSESILATAEMMFAKHGFENTTVRNMSNVSGFNAASLHYYFGSKENLLREIFRKRLNELRQQFNVLLQFKYHTPEDALNALFKILDHYCDRHATFLELFFREFSAFKHSSCKLLIFSFFRESVPVLEKVLDDAGVFTLIQDHFLFMYSLLVMSHPLMGQVSRYESLFLQKTNPMSAIPPNIRFKNYLLRPCIPIQA